MEVSLHCVVVGDGRGLVGVHADLFQNHFLLDIEIVLTQCGKQNARLDFKRLRQVFRQCGSVVNRTLFTGGGVVVGTHFIEDPVYVFGRETFGSLEGHVFEKVADARNFWGFIASTRLHIKAERNAMHVRIRFGNNFESVFQRRMMKGHAIFLMDNFVNQTESLVGICNVKGLPKFSNRFQRLTRL